MKIQYCSLFLLSVLLIMLVSCDDDNDFDPSNTVIPGIPNTPDVILPPPVPSPEHYYNFPNNLPINVSMHVDWPVQWADYSIEYDEFNRLKFINFDGYVEGSNGRYDKEFIYGNSSFIFPDTVKNYLNETLIKEEEYLFDGSQNPARKITRDLRFDLINTESFTYNEDKLVSSCRILERDGQVIDQDTVVFSWANDELTSVQERDFSITEYTHNYSTYNNTFQLPYQLGLSDYFHRHYRYHLSTKLIRSISRDNGTFTGITNTVDTSGRIRQFRYSGNTVTYTYANPAPDFIVSEIDTLIRCHNQNFTFLCDASGSLSGEWGIEKVICGSADEETDEYGDITLEFSFENLDVYIDSNLESTHTVALYCTGSSPASTIATFYIIGRPEVTPGSRFILCGDRLLFHRSTPEGCNFFYRRR